MKCMSVPPAMSAKTTCKTTEGVDLHWFLKMDDALYPVLRLTEAI